MDANVHAYMHICMEINALCTHKYEIRKKKSIYTISQYANTHTPMHACTRVCINMSISIPLSL